jgi:hypothetical protein
LFTYGPINFELDIAIENIMAPSDKDIYSRINPICSNPLIVIRNLGKLPVKKLTIEYGLQGSPPMEYIWGGNLGFLEKEEIVLPAPDWQGFDESLEFFVRLVGPNNGTDERTHNNDMSSSVVRPEILPAEFVLYIEPNDLGRDRDNEYFLTDACGSVIFKREDFTTDTLFRDQVKLDPGCYEFRLSDKVEDGMNRHWWYYYENPELMGKNGKIEIHDTEGNVIRKFAYDFGQEILYRFSVK